MIELEKEGDAIGDGSGSKKGEELIVEEIMPQLEKLMQDEDADVRFFATTAGKVWTDGEGADAVGETAMET